ncbi:MAG TPA: ribosome maturation factor, partial [Campylobacterales bacterium]|nr:ribosome maturation factor [Campylobacterales bacterium]
SRILSPLFDVTPPVDGEYILEVSSPGIERKLTKLFHYQNSINELVKIKHSELGKLKGRILSVNKDSFTIKNKENKEELELNYADIITAKTYYPW